MKKEKRFVMRDNESFGFATSVSVIIDRETGVNYLFAVTAQGVGLTPLLDHEGKPLVTAVYDEE